MITKQYNGKPVPSWILRKIQLHQFGDYVYVPHLEEDVLNYAKKTLREYIALIKNLPGHDDVAINFKWIVNQVQFLDQKKPEPWFIIGYKFMQLVGE